MPASTSQLTNFDDYIAQFPPEVQQILLQIRMLIHKTAPEAVEKISYNMPAFFLNGGLIWFGAYKRHIAIYPKTAVMMENIPELASFKGTKGSVHFPLDKPMPFELLRKIVRVRLHETQQNTTA